MNNVKKVLVAVVFLTVASCNTVPDNFDWGYVIEGSYQNKFFDIAWQIPDNWEYDDTYAQQWAKTANPEFVRLAEAVYESKQRIKMPPQQVKETLLFRLNKSEQASILLYAENLSLIEGADIKDLDDYMVQTLSEAKGNAQITLDSEDYESERIGGATFYKLTGTLSVHNTKALEQYYFTVINGFGLTVLLNAQDETAMVELEKALEFLSF